MGRYSYLHTAFRNKEFMELWAKRDDVSQTMPFGKFVGYEGVYQSYVGFHGDRNNPEDNEAAAGADDDPRDVHRRHRGGRRRQDRQGHLDLPGHRDRPLSPARRRAPGAGGKYEVEFIKEDGVWKFWHMTLYPLFLTPYNRSWGEPPSRWRANGEMPDMGPYCHHPLEKPFWEYGPDAIYPEDEPAVPPALRQLSRHLSPAAYSGPLHPFGPPGAPAPSWPGPAARCPGSGPPG